jgi:hypothetical protein
LLGVGSTARFAQPNDHIWGSGIICRSDYLNPKATYHAVRGPLTRQRVLDCGGDCPAVFGDPALLLPRWIDTSGILRRFELGVVPHYADQQQLDRSHFPDSTVFINVLNARPEVVIGQICMCKRIISSSLHGIIVAHAYGIPARWGKFSDNLSGDDVKFLDYFLSVGIKPYEPDKSKVLPDHFEPVELNIDLDALWEARPWR